MKSRRCAINRSKNMAFYFRVRSAATALLFLIAVGAMWSRPAAAQEGQRPNILFAIADDASYPHMSAYGTTWVETPGFDRVARGGLLFNRAYTPNAKCAPSRASILTGRNSWQLEEAANHWAYFPRKFRTYPEALARDGYHVGFTGKGWAPGIPGEIDGEPRQLVGPAYEEHSTNPPAQHISSVDYAANFEDFLASNEGDRPFCFWYGGHEPHRAYEHGAGIREGGKELDDVARVMPSGPTTRRYGRTFSTMRTRSSTSAGICSRCSICWKSAASSRTRSWW